MCTYAWFLRSEMLYLHPVQSRRGKTDTEVASRDRKAQRMGEKGYKEHATFGNQR